MSKEIRALLICSIKPKSNLLVAISPSGTLREGFRLRQFAYAGGNSFNGETPSGSALHADKSFVTKVAHGETPALDSLLNGAAVASSGTKGCAPKGFSSSFKRGNPANGLLHRIVPRQRAALGTPATQLSRKTALSRFAQVDKGFSRM